MNSKFEVAVVRNLEIIAQELKKMNDRMDRYDEEKAAARLKRIQNLNWGNNKEDDLK